MPELNDTSLFDVRDIKNAEIAITLKEIVVALEKSGYNPINQLVGYIISGDPGYITSRFDARAKLSRIDRSDLVGEVIKGYLSK